MCNPGGGITKLPSPFWRVVGLCRQFARRRRRLRLRWPRASRAPSFVLLLPRFRRILVSTSSATAVCADPHPSRERASRVAVVRPAASAASVMHILFPISLYPRTFFLEFALTLSSVLEISLNLNNSNRLMIPNKCLGFNWTPMSHVRSASEPCC